MLNQVVLSTYEDASDRDEVVSLWALVFPDDPPWNEPSQVIDKKLRHAPELFLVARKNRDLVATVIGGYDGVRGWMYHLATHPEHRKSGIARLLVEELEQRLTELGCVKVNLQVREGNDVVSAFYEKLGYEIEPRTSLGKRLKG